jgi:hypothetical protein
VHETGKAWLRSSRLDYAAVRRSRHAASALAALAAIVLAGCSPLGDESEPAIPATTLPMLVLQPGDLDGAFVRFDEGPLAIADSPVGERADPERFGREGGWKARYRRQDATEGPLVVESRVDLFDGSGAEEELDLHRDELELQARSPSDLELVDVPELGDEAFALAAPEDAEPGSFVSITVAWRDTNVTASVTANGLGGRLELADVVALARAQQERIDAALHPS